MDDEEDDDDPANGVLDMRNTALLEIFGRAVLEKLADTPDPVAAVKQHLLSNPELFNRVCEYVVDTHSDVTLAEGM